MKPGRECRRCGKPRPRQNKEFCSKACRRSATFATTECEFCGQKFETRNIYLARGQMKFCSVKCGATASRKHEVQEFNGAKYYRDVRGYFVNPRTLTKMHRDVWAHYNGAVPDGYVIHHLNHDKGDNRIENLSLVEWANHTSQHSKERWASGKPMGKRKRQSKCRSEGCSRPAKAKNLCTKHYQKMKAGEGRKWL